MANHVLQTLSLDVLLTHKYVGEFKHLDRAYDLGVVEVLDRASGQKRDTDQTNYLTVEVRLNGRFRLPNIMRALMDTFSARGCSCLHDCCGCVSYNAHTVTQDEYNENRFYIVQDASANY